MNAAMMSDQPQESLFFYPSTQRQSLPSLLSLCAVPFAFAADSQAQSL
jgi:hypothetical protein